MTRKMLVLGAGLLVCLLVAPILAAGTPAALSPRDVSIVGGQWTWASGLNRTAESEPFGVYGTKGVAAPENVPGIRTGSVSWTDASGTAWLFGGEGGAAGMWGYLNDLWKWDGTTWTWVSGSNGVNQVGVYGTKGVAAPGNVPGARFGSVSWTDANGTLWLFGGSEENPAQVRFLNDLWKWDGTNWTWMSGSNVPNQHGTYGTKGVAAAGNVPGARYGSVSWTDASGILWLFGGDGFTAGSSGLLNDLWKWDGTSWTWVSGSNAPWEPGTYGTKGEAAPGNVPGARAHSISWTDASGSFWLFGGYGLSAGSDGYLNDLWKWDGINWMWISGSDSPGQYGTYGTKGVAAPANVPGARQGSTSWRDESGNLWLFGGEGYATTIAGCHLNDLWKWDGTSWTWVSGSDDVEQRGTYGTKGVAAAGNVPGARAGSVSWADASGSLWLFGGWGLGAYGGGDLWKWDGTNWTWVSGSTGEMKTGTYGTKGVPASANVPGVRAESISWTASGGNLWLFGGQGFDAIGGFWLNDLWRWDGTNWTWVSGSDGKNQPGTYGTKGVSAPENVPGARHLSLSWTDPSGSLWLFGGSGYAATGVGWLNDLWKWNGTNWTWVSGSDVVNQFGVYGTKGVAAPGNVPGARQSPVSWTDASGNLWLFGGYGSSAGGWGFFNDLWKWDGTNWTWVSGSDATDQHGTYGTKGVAAPGNVPGSRSGSVSWTDAGGVFWLFGGLGLGASGSGGSGHLNDLWKWDGSSWTWMSGSDGPNQGGTFGTKGVPAPENVPGARVGAVSWTDAAGNLWLFGGHRFTSNTGELNDLWRWDGTNWTWVSGSDSAVQSGTYGTKGVAAPANVPGARQSSVSWTDAGGNLWLFGGSGYDTQLLGTLNDLWVFGTTCTNVAPPTAGNGGPYATGATIALTASTVAGATYLWTGPNGFASTVQNPTIPNATLEMAGTYSVAIIVGGCSSAATTTTVVVVPGHTLTVSKSGSGIGNVSSSPSGLDCGSTCAASFPSGSQVTLTATADGGSRFAGWIGEGCFGTDPCTVTMDAARNVSATFLPSGGVGLYTLTPCRIVDTRDATGPYGGPALDAGTARAFTIAGQCGVPAGASAVALNVTVTNPTSAGSLTAYPGTGAAPGTSTVSFAAGRTRANNATIGLVDGILSVVNHQVTGATDVIIDVSGYYR